MKYFACCSICLPLAMLFVSCGSQLKHAPTDQTPKPSTVSTPPTDTSLASHTTPTIDTSLFTKEDTVTITFAEDTLKYAQAEFNDIISSYPTLYKIPSIDPDIAYNIAQSSQTGDDYSFSSEVGQDEFYLFYAYLLRKKDTAKTCKGIRDTLSQIYHTVNGIYAQLNEGGTFFGHQHSRIAGYVEYAVNNLDFYYNHYHQKPYSIQAQRTALIQMLNQQITDEVATNNDWPDKTQKNQQRKELFAKTAQLNRLISNYFYLHETRQFLFSYYDVM